MRAKTYGNLPGRRWIIVVDSTHEKEGISLYYGGEGWRLKAIDRLQDDDFDYADQWNVPWVEEELTEEETHMFREVLLGLSELKWI